MRGQFSSLPVINGTRISFRKQLQREIAKRYADITYNTDGAPNQKTGVAPARVEKVLFSLPAMIVNSVFTRSALSSVPEPWRFYGKKMDMTTSKGKVGL
jgi:hypothetical protein